VLGRLPETQRRVLELRMGLADGHPHDLADTARELGLSLGEAREIEQRAFEHIREAIPLQQLQRFLAPLGGRVSSLEELVEQRSGLRGSAVDLLQVIVSDWQILADLSFSDLLLFCREPTTGELTVVAQMRPYTAQTIYNEDLVGTTFTPDRRPAVVRAFEEGVIVRDGDPDWSTGVPVREEAIPVPFDGEVVAVVTREANLSMVRAPSQLELTYLQAANELSQMLAEGDFPFPGEDPERELAPRVGDGLLRLDPTGVVVYASPNAISAYRRLGVVDNILGRNLGDFDLDQMALLEALADGEPSTPRWRRAARSCCAGCCR
jgi:two-component system, sensor histidine kinase PdtaS